MTTNANHTPTLTHEVPVVREEFEYVAGAKLPHDVAVRGIGAVRLEKKRRLPGGKESLSFEGTPLTDEGEPLTQGRISIVISKNNFLERIVGKAVKEDAMSSPFSAKIQIHRPAA